jgi:hypothetical protein
MTLLAGVLAIIGLLSGFLLYRGADAALNDVAPKTNETLANLTGEKAVNHLKETGATNRSAKR